MEHCSRYTLYNSLFLSEQQQGAFSSGSPSDAASDSLKMKPKTDSMHCLANIRISQHRQISLFIIKYGSCISCTYLCCSCFSSRSTASLSRWVDFTLLISYQKHENA